MGEKFGGGRRKSGENKELSKKRGTERKKLRIIIQQERTRKSENRKGKENGPEGLTPD